MSDGGAVAWVWGEPSAPDAAAVAKLTAPTSRIVECMGWTFERALLQWSPNAGERESENSPGPSSPASDANNSPTNKKKKALKGKEKPKATKLTEQELEGDHYDVLGLDEEEWEATDEQIARWYKKKCLEHHPDKTGGDDTMFKKVQVAGDVLMNLAKRKGYDSSLPFDDAIPPVKVAPEKFYTTFGPVFERNMKWCVQGKDVPPLLGDDAAPLETVDLFYKFWLDFKSWRDYSFAAAEHDLETAEYREERRWMEKENQKGVDKKKKAEMVRIHQLVERAYKQDPRLRRRDAAIAAEKEAKNVARREEEERKKREAIEAEERAKADASQAKLDKKAILALEKKARQSIRKMVRDYEGYGNNDITKADLDWLLTKISLAEMNAIAADLTPIAKDRTEARFLVYTQIEKVEERVQETRKGKKMGGQDDAANANADLLRTQEVEWTAGELLDLQKACSKYPAGTYDRWSKLSEAMLEKKSPEECLKKVKKLEAEFRTPQQAAGGGMKDMMTCKTNLPAVQKKEGNQAELDYQDETNRKFKTPPSKTLDAETAAEKQATPPPASLEEHADPVADIWSASEQKAFETVLRDLKAYKDKDKWEKIAAAIGTKTKKQCVTRYKFLSGAVKK